MRKLIADSFVYAVIPKLSVVGSILILPIITRDLTKTDFGIYGLLMAYMLIFQAMRYLGLKTIMNNSFFNHPVLFSKVWRNIHGTIYLWGIPYSVLLALTIWIGIPEEAAANFGEILLLLLIPELVFNPIIFTTTRLLQLQQKSLLTTVIGTTGGIVTVISNLITISYFKMGYMGWFVSYFISFFIQSLFCANYVYRHQRMFPIFRLSRQTYRRYFKVSLPMIPHNLGGYLLNVSDKVIMGVLSLPVAEIGKYSLAASFGNHVETLGQAINTALVPTYLKEMSGKNSGYKQKLKFLTFMFLGTLLGATAIFSLWSKEILNVLIQNSELAAVYPMVIVLAMGSNYRPLYMGSVLYMMHAEETKNIWRIVFVAGVINIALNLIFLPIYGVEAAAVTTFVCFLWQGLAAFTMRTYKSFNNPNLYPVFWLSLISLITVFMFYAVDFPFVTKGWITIAFTMLIVLGLFNAYKKYKTY